MPPIDDARILIMATHGFEQCELEAPRKALSGAGAEVSLATPGGEDIRGWDKEDWGQMAFHDLSLASVSVAHYDALVIPGGQINPDVLRVNDRAVQIVREFVDCDKVVAAICHGPWMLIEADVVRGRRMTSCLSIRTDLENAGAEVIDRPVVVSERIITSRAPGDLRQFSRAIVEQVQGLPGHAASG